jgi:hypothetical protein
MYYELSKSQKKIARIVMDKGLENHYMKGLYDAESILQKWRSSKFENTREAYMKLFRSVKKNDENITRIYNDKGASRWVEVMADQLNEGVITFEDLKDFDEEVRNTIVQWSRIEE